MEGQPEGELPLPNAPDGLADDTHALAPPPASARQFHHYELCLREDGVTLHELGRGAMGVSYKARDVNLDTPVALKVISAALPAHIQARERFRREARAAAQLRHANVASVFHFGETPGGECFYAMEFIEGETLAARVQRDGPLAAPLVVEIALQVTAALIAADERGLVHRDLKPANLMLAAPPATRLPLRPGSVGSSPSSSSTGYQRVAVKVIDFGLAKAAVAAGAAMHWDAPLTQDGGFLGTPAYASPEQAEGGAVDARSDIYSLGVTLWYLLTGKVPFAARSLSEIYDRQLHRPLPLAQVNDLRVPAPLVELLRSMLAADPAERPESPAVLYEELERCREAIGSPSLPHPPHSEKPGRQPTQRWGRGGIAASLAALLLLLLAATAYWSSRHYPAPRTPERSIAVLPLENLSDDKENAFFADGIQDDVLASLSKINELKVISRSSVVGYRNVATRNLREIGQQLGVAHVLAGSVRRAKDRVLVNVELVDTRDGRQLWAERYDRTLSDSLTLQGELATEIAAALRATLSPEEKVQMAAKPTNDPEAYLLYLRGRAAQTTTGGLLEDSLKAARLYSEAIARDPDFALARARLSTVFSSLYRNGQPTAANRDRARAEADASLRLRPDLGEGHLARALCIYWLDKNYDAALEELAIARRLLPNDSYVGAAGAYIARRRGRWNEARERLHAVLARDPRNGQVVGGLLETDCYLRDWPAAMRTGDRAIALAPDSPAVVINRSYVDFWSRGDLGPLRAALATIPAGTDPDGFVTYARWDVAITERDFAAAERAVAACALDRLPNFSGSPLPKFYLLGCIALARGDEAQAKALFEATRSVYEAEVQTIPDDPYRHGQLGLIYAFLGRREEAIREGRRSVELLPESRDAVDGPQATSYLALILARCGQNDEALALIGRLLRTPSAVDRYEASITLAELRVRWQWDPLRGDPRFQKLLAGPEPQTVYK